LRIRLPRDRTDRAERFYGAFNRRHCWRRDSVAWGSRKGRDGPGRHFLTAALRQRGSHARHRRQRFGCFGCQFRTKTALFIEVGTPVARRPPHISRRAFFSHRALQGSSLRTNTPLQESWLVRSSTMRGSGMIDQTQANSEALLAHAVEQTAHFSFGEHDGQGVGFVNAEVLENRPVSDF
jgi:hypothetical protein